MVDSIVNAIITRDFHAETSHAVMKDLCPQVLAIVHAVWFIMSIQQKRDQGARMMLWCQAFGPVGKSINTFLFKMWSDV